MSARLDEIGRRMKVCLSDIERLRAERRALAGMYYPDVKDEDGWPFTCPEEWRRQAKLALVEAQIGALEGEYAALKIRKVVAELDSHVEREIERAKKEASLREQCVIGRYAREEVTERLDEAERGARRDLREMRLRYMTDSERVHHERRERERRWEREQEHGQDL
jgi:hypothetical protein